MSLTPFKNQSHTIDGGVNNPYRLALWLEKKQEKVLGGFYRLTENFFSDTISDSKPLSGQVRALHEKGGYTMEWELRQSSYTLLKKDFKAIIMGLIPSFVHQLAKRIERYSIIFFSMDALIEDMDEQFVHPEEAEKMIRLRDTMSRVVHLPVRLMHKVAPVTITFRDALKYMILKSLVRLKKVPALLSGFPWRIPVRPVEYLDTLSQRARAFIKNILLLIPNKRN